jgi:three-Cys-motif partner protein
MPVINGVGCSEETPRKLKDLRKALDVYFAIASQVVKNHNDVLTVIDATAGPGSYVHRCINCAELKCEKANMGSPLIIRQLLRYHGVSTRLILIDELKPNIMSLNMQFSNCEIPTKVLHGDYKEILKDITTSKYGLLLIDENGYPDFEFIKYFYKKNYTTIDLLLNVPSNAAKRGRNNSNLRLNDALEMVPKKYWAIRELRMGLQWTQIFGTNWSRLIRTLENYNEHFYGLDTQKGEEELEKASYTRDELSKKKATQLMLNI